ncbi:MAG: dihydroorotase [Deltaproteobacteria bacterium]|jgi:dihydroorotase|nr:dihydroorotase [Deltaproteobacteria bacterium]
MTKPILIKNGRLIDPAQDFDARADLLLEDGLVSAVDPTCSLSGEGKTLIEAKDFWVLPGLIDMHVHLRDPGHEYKEDLHSGLMAAAAGGFTTVLAMPNTSPPVDQAAQIRSLLSRAKTIPGARLCQSAAMTRGLNGQELTEYEDLKNAGASAVTDDGRWIPDAAVMRRVLGYAHVCGLPPLSHAQEATLAPKGQIHEGRVSTRLGLAGIPAEVESMAVYRDISLVRLTGKRLHICHVSSRLSLDLIRRAKAEGLPVTCETAPHYLFLTDEDVGQYDVNRKMNPPLRTAADQESLRQGIAEGVIDVVATDHAPHSVLEKEVEFMDAAFGVIGLETALPLTLRLAEELQLSPKKVAELLSLKPAQILGLPGGTLLKGRPADVTVIDPQAEYVYDVKTSKSKSRNSPFDGWKLKGQIVKTIVDGTIVFEG